MLPWNRKTETPSWTGGCQCGAVRYALDAPPDSACICHCRMCQKASGQPFMAFARAAEGLRWTHGQPAVFRSSSVAKRAFCKDCGTPLSIEYDDGALHIVIGTLDDPSAVEPTFQCGVESELGWCRRLGELPRSRTEDDAGADFVARLISYQRPDRDT
jgi:hypothetical protein